MRQVVAAFVAMAALAALLAACQPGDKSAESPATGDAGAAAGDSLIRGLPTEKERISYVIGMDMASSLEEIHDEIDVDTLVKAIRASVKGERLLVTEAQAADIREAFFTRLRSERTAELEAQARTNQEAGAAFLAENAKKPGVQTTASGLQYQVLAAGDGPKPDADAVVRVHYRGTLPDGTEFDSSYGRGEPAVFPLGQVVPGWREGVMLMPVGSKYRLWVPGTLGYGANGTPGGEIGPNQTLVFEVELLDIVQASAE